MQTVTGSRVLRIDITGQDRSGVTYPLTNILGKYGVRILDIGQAVIHDALALGILVELNEEIRSSPMLSELLLEAHALGDSDSLPEHLRQRV